MKHICIILIAFIIVTILHFDRLKYNYNNCSLKCSIFSDIFAYICGSILLYLGIIKYNNILITFIGTSVIVEHIWQLYLNKI